MTVVAVVLLIALLILLISWGRVPPFAAFLAVALLAALFFDMPLDAIGKSLERGVGDMLGGLAAIICLGAMFGRTIADSGAARSIADALIGVVGVRFIAIALAMTGLVVGIPLFYSVGFVILVPLVFSLGATTRLPLVYLGIPLLCGLSVSHGFLPPHPSPIALVKIFGADMGLTLIYGMIVGSVAVMIAGPLLAQTLKGIASAAPTLSLPRRPGEETIPAPLSHSLRRSGAETDDSAQPSHSLSRRSGEDTHNSAQLSHSLPRSPGEGQGGGVSEATASSARSFAESPPGSLNSCFTALLPVALITAATAIAYVPHGSPRLETVAAFIGQPAVALMVSLIYATFSLWIARGKSFKALMQAQGASLQDVAGILLILAGAGALKQVFVDGGVSAQLGAWLQTVPLQPLILGWLIAVVIRVALGSATIAGLTAAGIVAPVIAATGVDPNLMVLAIGAGSLMFSHVNDAGFWLFKEYFNLSLKDTFRSWTVMESLAGLVGLVCVLALDLMMRG